MKQMNKVYYLYQGDRFIDVGTVHEIAKRQHLSEGTLYSYITRSKVCEKGPFMGEIEGDENKRSVVSVEKISSVFPIMPSQS